MTCEKFQNSGVFFQSTSKNAEMAAYRFDISCYRCAMWGLQLHCEQCSIKAAFIRNCERFGVPVPEDA